MNQAVATPAIAQLTMTPIDDLITRVIDPRVPNEVTFFLRGNEHEDYDQLRPSVFISTMGNHGAGAGTFNTTATESAYLEAYNSTILQKITRDLYLSMALEATNLANGACSAATPYEDSNIYRGVTVFQTAMKHTAELILGEPFSSSDDILRALWSARSNGKTSGALPFNLYRPAPEHGALQTIYGLYAWTMMIPLTSTVEQAMNHLQHSPTMQECGQLWRRVRMPSLIRLTSPTGSTTTA